jgi:methionine sulfoxide reductase catalytic subunit
MLLKRPEDILSSEITPQSIYLNRRNFMRTAGIVAIGAFAGCKADSLEAQAKLQTTKRMVTTTEAQTSFEAITTYNNFYEFGSQKEDPSRNSAPFKPKPWSVAVEGECLKPGTFALEDILKPHPLEERVYRLRCVEGWSMVIPWVGFPLADLLKRFQPTAKAKFVEFTTVLRPQEMVGQRQTFPRPLLPWPYKEGLRIDEAMHPLTLVAVGLYGQELLNQNGAPIRIVVPWKYGFKSAKSIVKIRFVEQQPLTTWVQAAPTYYGFYSNVNPNVATDQGDQRAERRIGNISMRRTLMFNGYEDQVASLYAGMDLRKNY